MANLALQVSIFGGVLFFFTVIVFFLRRNSFCLKYTLLWLLTAFAMLCLNLLPGVLPNIARFFGFEVASNALFTLLLGFVIIILLQQTAIVSQQSEKIKTLVQQNALLEKRLRDLENNIAKGKPL